MFATQALEYLRANNVYCLISPSHASIWAQANDAGVNASSKSVFGNAVRVCGASLAAARCAGQHLRAPSPAPGEPREPRAPRPEPRAPSPEPRAYCVRACVLEVRSVRDKVV